MRIFGIQPEGSFNEYSHEPFQEGHIEKTLQDWLESNPEGILEENELLILGREVLTDQGARIDLLGVDSAGDVVVVELKRGRTPRDTVAQALEYAAFAERLNVNQLEEIFQTYMNDESLNFAEHHRQHFELSTSDAVSFNKNQRIVIVGQEIAPRIRQTSEFLNSKGVSVTCVEFAFFRAQDGGRLFSQEIVVDEDSRRPFQVSSSAPPKVDESSFLGSLNENGKKVISRFIEWSKIDPRRIKWGTKAFATHVEIGNSTVSLFRAYPPSRGQKEVLIITFNEVEKKSAVPAQVIADLRAQAESTGLFRSRGPKDFQRTIDCAMSEKEIDNALSVLNDLAEAVRKHGMK